MGGDEEGEGVDVRRLVSAELERNLIGCGMGGVVVCVLVREGVEECERAAAGRSMAGDQRSW